jgi:hypothetical protein
VVDKIDQCADVYRQALEKLPNSDMFDKYLTTLFEASRSVGKDEAEKVFMAVKVMDAFALAQKLDVLSDKHQQIYRDLVADAI